MAQVLLFHHAQGLTEGVRAFAVELERAGHVVTTPDLFAGRTFSSVEEGVAHAESIGFDEVIRRGVAAAAALPAELVPIGFSLGALPAEHLAVTRPGARAAVLLHAAAAPEAFGAAWPAGVPLQIHAMADDPWMAEDLPVARALAESLTEAELHLNPGDGHLFTDSSLAEYDPAAAALVLARIRALLSEV